jgi:hypothetical protein
MLRFILSAALVVSTSTAAFAGQSVRASNLQPEVTQSYTFADSAGAPYCDGLTLTETGTVAKGFHTGTCERSPLPYAGGFQVKITAITDTLYDIVTTDPNDPKYTLDFLIDQVALTWQGWVEDTAGRVPFQETNSGRLLTGKPAAATQIFRPSMWQPVK